MNHVEAGLVLLAAVGCSAVALSAPGKARADRLSAARESMADESVYSTNIAPEFVHRYRFYEGPDSNINGQWFLLEDQSHQQLCKLDKQNFGRGLILDNRHLKVQTFAPGKPIKHLDRLSRSYEVSLLDGADVFAQLQIIEEPKSKGYDFQYGGNTYQLRWARSSGIWGLLGDVIWPAQLINKDTVIAQITRRDAQRWRGDYANKTLLATKEDISPQLLAITAFLTCSNFFPRRHT